ncbi:hypothetical protein C8R43DRAFT_1131082 [Mycena crocata]|nr:hypothetical protein C8R43DRAFT_1131082 [Mycena crocata]
MPRNSSKTVEVLHYTQAAAATLRDIASSIDVPFLSTITALLSSIIPLVQGAKTNKDRCVRMVDEVHQLLCSIANLAIEPEDPTPKLLDQIAGIAQTLQKFYAYLRSQQEIGRITRFFKQTELTIQLDACEAEIRAALEVFMIRSGAEGSVEIAKMDADIERRHQELLDLIESWESQEFSDTASSTRRTFTDINSSSMSLPLLPPPPQIFYGREPEIEAVVGALLSDSPRVAILGMGGMGKTALATAALYEPSVVERYQQRHFVSCESADNAAALVTLIGSYLGIEPSASLSRMITKYFSDCGPSILVLDNLETPWEPLPTRSDVEEFLSLLSDIPQLAIVITMRGAERPAKTKWTRPFLLPLEPISSFAARKTFVDIADDPSEAADEEALTELLDLTGNLPLALTLMANIASFESYAGALARWKTESTGLLSDGAEKTSNLDVSIKVSLASPRLASSPHAMELLSLISLLPDGISEDDLLASRVPIPGISSCRSALLRTSLVYIDQDGRIKSLSPIRSYIQRFHWPSRSVTDPLRRYFQDLMSVWFSRQQMSSGKLVPRLTSHLGNIRSLVLDPLRANRLESAGSEIGYNILSLNNFCHIMLKGMSPLMKDVPRIVESTNDSRLRWKYSEDCLLGLGPPLTREDAEKLIRDGIQHFAAENNRAAQVTFYNTAVTYYMRVWDMAKAREYNNLAFELAKDIDDVLPKLTASRSRATIGNLTGHYRESIESSMEVIRLARIMGSVPHECNGLMDEALSRSHLGELRQVQSICLQTRQLVQASGLDGSNREIAILDMEAEVHLLKSEYIQARDLNTAVLQMTSPDVMPYFHANALIFVAHLCILIGVDESEIREKLKTAKELTDKLGWTSRKIMCEQEFAALALYLGDTQSAHAAFKACISRSGMEDAEAAFIGLEYLGDWTHSMCTLDETFQWAGTYFALARKSNDLGRTYQALRCLGDILLAQGDETTALSVFRAVLAGATEMDVHRRRADCMVRIGDILKRRGNVEEAREMWQTARPLFFRSSQRKETVLVDQRLARTSYDARD